MRKGKEERQVMKSRKKDRKKGRKERKNRRLRTCIERRKGRKD